MGGTVAISKAARAGFAAAAFAVAGVVAYACADTGTSPTWELAKDNYDPGGNGAFLTPGNDTRVNLMLLLADRRGTVVRHPAARREGPPLVLFPWKVMSAAAGPPAQEAAAGEWREPSRCQSHAAGAAAFAAAVRANPRVPKDERQRLAAARAAFVPDCSGAGGPSPRVAASSRAGRAFAAYLDGAGNFYSGRFEEASGAFAGLTAAPDPWV
ncbi:MAG TPA: hypothetical protein VK403_05570, partial [Allosphingosinicella sp.]|nr:hypothetical protein [Allosphingosinicella sp.]